MRWYLIEEHYIFKWMEIIQAAAVYYTINYFVDNIKVLNKILYQEQTCIGTYVWLCDVSWYGH